MEDQDAPPRMPHHHHHDDDDTLNNEPAAEAAGDEQHKERRLLLLLLSWRQHATHEAGLALARLMAYVALGCACGGAGLPVLLPLAVAYCVEKADSHTFIIVAQGVCATQASLLCLGNHTNHNGGWLAGYAVTALWSVVALLPPSSLGVWHHYYHQNLRAPVIVFLVLCALATQQPQAPSSWWLQLLFYLARAAAAAAHSLWLRVTTADAAGPSPLLLAPCVGALGLAVFGVAVHAVVFLMLTVMLSSPTTTSTSTTTTTTTTAEKPFGAFVGASGVVRLPLQPSAAAPLPHDPLFNTDTIDVQEAFRLAKAQYRNTTISIKVESSKSN